MSKKIKFTKDVYKDGAKVHAVGDVVIQTPELARHVKRSEAIEVADSTKLTAAPASGLQALYVNSKGKQVSGDDVIESAMAHAKLSRAKWDALPQTTRDKAIAERVEALGLEPSAAKGE